MKRRILYSILNEWRDEDIEDFPLDLDDMDFEPTSSNMDNVPDLNDDDFELSTIHSQYEYFPKTREELKKIVDMEIEKQGGEHVNLNMINTSEITDMFGIFWNYKSLRSLDVSGWDVSKVRDMYGMFDSCILLETLDVSRWKLSSVKNMRFMFAGCKSLRELDVSNWKVSGVVDMGYMFVNCESLHTDTRKWEINAEDTTDMYYNAPNIDHN